MTFIANEVTGVIHESRLATEQCNLDDLDRSERLTPEKVVQWLKDYNYRFCMRCFPNEFFD